MDALNAPTDDRNRPTFLVFHQPDLLDEVYSKFTVLERSGISAADLTATTKELVDAAWQQEKKEREAVDAPN